MQRSTTKETIRRPYTIIVFRTESRSMGEGLIENTQSYQIPQDYIDTQHSTPVEASIFTTLPLYADHYEMHLSLKEPVIALSNEDWSTRYIHPLEGVTSQCLR